MSEKNIKTYTAKELRDMRERGEDQTDWERLARMKDEDIDLSDIPELDEQFWDNAQLAMPDTKERITIRVDQDVLDYFRESGPGYQTRMNAVLRSFVTARKEKAKRSDDHRNG